jgi:long-chain fatty acid transport protein
MLKLAAWLTALTCFLATAGLAFAEGFSLYEYSARGVALGGALLARKPDPSAVAYNPALLTRLPGVHAMAGVTAVAPTGKLDWTEANGNRGTTALRDAVWPVPHGYYTQQINDDWFFGVGEFTRYGLGFEFPHDWVGRFNMYDVALISTSLNPVIAWNATYKLSLALGPEIVYVNLDLKKRSGISGEIPIPNQPPIPYNFEVDSSIRNAEAFGIGGNIAAHYQFNEQWAVGAQYRSQVRVHAFGDIEYSFLNYNGPAAFEQATQAQFARNFKDGTAHAVVILPDSFSGGVSWTPVPEFSLEAGAIWTRWSTFRSLNIHLPVGRSDSPKHWKDVWRLNLGAEYDLLDWLTVRAGLVWDQSPMTSRYQDYLVPTDDRWIYSAGLGFRWDAWTLDLAYAYIKPSARSYDADPAPAGTGTVKSRTRDSYTQLFSLSLGYEF